MAIKTDYLKVGQTYIDKSIHSWHRTIVAINDGKTYMFCHYFNNKENHYPELQIIDGIMCHTVMETEEFAADHYNCSAPFKGCE